MHFKFNEEQITFRIINKEAVFLNLQTGFYYSLNKTGTLVFELIKKGKSREEVIDYFSKEFKDGSINKEKDVDSLIKDLLKEKIILKCP